MEGIDVLREVKNIFDSIKDSLCDYWGDNLISIVVFGSAASKKADKDSDLDLLIVVREIEKNRLKRIPEIVKLKRKIACGWPLDILLVSREECQDNFRNHNPLYLDIAIEGRVLFDRGLVDDLMKSTREYIRKRNIKTDGNAWFFPVRPHVATELSPVNNQDWANIWLRDGERDLQTACILKEQELYEKCAYHCQQAVEKAIKAVLICFGGFEKTHFVAERLRAIVSSEVKDEGWGKRLIEIAEIGEEIEPQVSLSRYPNFDGDRLWVPFEEYGCEEANNLLNKAQLVVEISQQFVTWWFK